MILRARLTAPPPLRETLNARFPGLVTEDRGLGLGSIFSGLWCDPSDGALSFWGVSDRGPNTLLKVGGDERRTLAVPEYDPLIVRVHVRWAPGGPELAVDDVIAIVGADQKPVTGRPNRSDVDEKPYDVSGGAEIKTDMSGLDPEALVRTSTGEFWIAEEYGPSLVHVARDGTVLKRLVPSGCGITGARYPVMETLPAVYARRAANRGFESLAISGDGKLLYSVIQSPLANPDKAAAKSSRIARVLVVETASGRPVAEHVLVVDPVSEYRETKQGDVKISDAVWLGPNALLIDERTDARARIHSVDLSRAAQILGSKWDDPGTSPSLESLSPADLTAQSIAPCSRTLVCDLNAVVPDLPAKIEGLALIDRRTIAVGNDNEFNTSGYGADGKMLRAGDALSEILVIRLPEPLP